MDLSQIFTGMPFIWYLFDPTNIPGTYIFGFLGVLICLIAVVATWYQIMNEPTHY